MRGKTKSRSLSRSHSRGRSRSRSRSRSHSPIPVRNRPPISYRRGAADRGRGRDNYYGPDRRVHSHRNGADQDRFYHDHDHDEKVVGSGGKGGNAAGRGTGGRSHNIERRDRIVPPLVATVPVDRNKTCPMLVRCFWTQDRHRRPQDFGNIDRLSASNREIQIHTWQDATLHEITHLIQSANSPAAGLARAPGARISFAIVSPDRDGRFQTREVGCVGATSILPASLPPERTKPSDDGARSLAAVGFAAGDYLDIAIISSIHPPNGLFGRLGAGKGLGKGKGTDGIVGRIGEATLGGKGVGKGKGKGKGKGQRRR